MDKKLFVITDVMSSYGYSTIQNIIIFILLDIFFNGDKK